MGVRLEPDTTYKSTGPAKAGHYVRAPRTNQWVRLKPDATHYVYFGCVGDGAGVVLVGGAGDGAGVVPVGFAGAGAGARGALDGGGPAVPLTSDPGPR